MLCCLCTTCVVVPLTAWALWWHDTLWPRYREIGECLFSESRLPRHAPSSPAAWFGCPSVKKARAPAAGVVAGIDEPSAIWYHTHRTDRGSGTSQHYQDAVLMQVFHAIGHTNRYFVEFGARRPSHLNSAYFRKSCGWCGLLLDGSPVEDGPFSNPFDAGPEDRADQEALLGSPNGSCSRLRREFLTTDNVNEVFSKHGVPSGFDLLTIDIDRNDAHILRALDTERFGPRVIAVEFAGYFRPGELCVQRYVADQGFDWKACLGLGFSRFYEWPYRAWHIFKYCPVMGASLGAIQRILGAKGYHYVAQVAGEHAIFARADELHPQDRDSPLPRSIPQGWQYLRRTEDMEAAGYNVTAAAAAYDIVCYPDDEFDERLL